MHTAVMASSIAGCSAVGLSPSARWTGDLVDGKYDGEGTLTHDDFVHKGQFLGGLPNGKGTRTNETTSHVFKGTWKDGYLDDGSHTSESGSVIRDIYSGQWNRGSYSGEGEWESKDGTSKYKGQWRDNVREGRGKNTDSAGTYQGQWKNDKRHTGDVSMEHPNEEAGGTLKCGGFTYTGQFVEDMKDGSGNCQWPNGCQYEGQFQKDKMNGSGKMMKPDGEVVFEGEWIDDKPHGKGCMPADGVTNGHWEGGELKSGAKTFRDGREFTGTFDAGRRPLHGAMKYPTSQLPAVSYDVYEGGFLNGKRHGRGTMVMTDGATVNGIFDNGEIKSGLVTLANGDTFESGETGRFDANGKLIDGVVRMRQTAPDDVDQTEETWYEGSIRDGKRREGRIVNAANRTLYSVSYGAEGHLLQKTSEITQRSAKQARQ